MIRIRHGHVGLSVVLALTAGFVAHPATGSAQETREATIAAQQAAKAAATTPAALTKAERRFVTVKNNVTNPPTGLFPAFGSVMSGGGFAAGPGYRYVANDTTTVIAKGLWSIRGYKQADIAVDSVGLASGLVNLTFDGGWRDGTRVGFYGIGMQPPPPPVAVELDDHGRTDYRVKQTWAAARVTLMPERVFVLGGGVGFEHYAIESGKGGHVSTDAVYTDVQAPGLGQTSAFVHAQGTAGIDWRPSPGYARRGGLYAVSLHQYVHTDDRFSFARVDADVVQHLPIVRESIILSLRGRVESTLGDDDVPFYLLPALGGSHTLRGYAPGRFRDRHSLLMSAEYRWTPNRAGLDAAIFIDSGKVASSRSDLDFEGLKTSIGFGLRLHTPAATPLRIEIARSNEGLRLIFGTSAAF
jgi:hypothetical protein